MVSPLVHVNALLCCLILTLFLWYFSIQGHKLSVKQSLSGCYLSYIFSIITEIIWIFINGNPDFRALSYIVTSLDFICMAFLTYFWFLYFRESIFCPFCKTKIGKFVTILPLVIVILLAIFSIHNDFIFSITADGVYHRGPFFFLLKIGYIYLPLIALLAMVSHHKTIRVDQKRRFIIMAFCSLAPVIMGMIQTILPPAQLPTLHFTFVICFIVMYLNDQDQRITYDTLTSLLNRFGFIKMLEDNINSYKKKPQINQMFMLVGDVDNFKQINDTYGHREGDHALQLVASTLSEVALRYGANVGHISGDEFAVLMYAPSIQLPEEYCDAVQECLSANSADKPYTLAISLGISQYDGVMSYPDFINAADQEMYNIKKAKKERI